MEIIQIGAQSDVFFFGCQLVTPGEWETDGDGASLFKAESILRRLKLDSRNPRSHGPMVLAEPFKRILIAKGMLIKVNYDEEMKRTN